MEQKISLDMPIEELDFSTRSYNCLTRSGILTLGALVDTSRRELGCIKNMGAKSMEVELDKSRSDSLYTEMFCRSKRMYREDIAKAAGFIGLDDLEAEAWNKLLEAFSEETES